MTVPKTKAVDTGPKARTTLKDIAAHLGVSAMTVSLALRGDSQIPQGTRDRVRKAAEDLRYVPQESGRRLRSGRSGRLAYVAARISHSFVGEILVGLEQRALDSGRFHNRILPFATWYHIDEREKVLREILYGGQADAVVMASMKPSPELVLEFQRHRVPVVLIEDQAPGCWSVKVDNIKGARQATDHLIGRGCGRLGLVVGQMPPEGVELNPTSLERRRGYQDALRAAGRAVDPALVADVAYFSFEEGRVALDALLKAEPKLDGIFCAAGDRVAMGIMERARELKRRIPQDLKLVGYDDLQASRLLDPPLSSVHQNAGELGAAALDLACEALDHPGREPKALVFDAHLEVRASA